jgi:3-oxoacyl-[acyl-carrier protein] reductase
VDLGLSGKTAVVCASTAGLGAATARALAQEHANVVISGRRGQLARDIAASLPSAIGVGVDQTAPDGPERLVAQASSAFGDIDVLVLNGPGPTAARALDVTPEDVTAAVDSLVQPHVRLARLVLPGMRQRRWGRVLAIGSSGIVEPLRSLALSNLARAALAGYLKTLAAEVAADGITVNLLLPGRIATDRLAGIDEFVAEQSGQSLAAVRAQGQREVPAGRYGRPDEFGQVAAFLCSEPASYVTGTALRCDGGLVRSL